MKAVWTTFRRFTLTAVFVLATGSTTVSTAAAQRVTATAIESPGNARMAGVTVCLGTAQDRDREGLQTTNSQGQALFSDAPNESLIVTAHKDGYAGRERSIQASSYDRSAVLPLVNGSGGPRCPSGAGTGGGSDIGTSGGSTGGRFGRISTRPTGPITPITAPRITAFAIGWWPACDARVPARRSVPLHVQYRGREPSHWRVSERSNFAGARWFSWPGPGFLNYTFQGEPGTRRLYVQLRAGGSGSVSPVLLPVSNVMSDAVQLEGAPVRCAVELVYRDGRRNRYVVEKGDNREFRYAQDILRLIHRGPGSSESADGSLFFDLESVLPGFIPFPNAWLNENQSETMEWHERLKRLSCRDFAP